MNQPRISIIVIAYDMPRQALNTIYSLTSNHQKNCGEEEYEIIVVENNSDNNLSREKVLSMGRNIRYFLRNEGGVSPAPAINFAIDQCKSDFIGLIIDGARLATPRIIENALLVEKFSHHSLLCIPSYFLGPCQHCDADDSGWSEEKEVALLNQIRWKENGYRVFDACVMSVASPRGFFQPFLESNCLFTSRQSWNAIRKTSECFGLEGGGALAFYQLKMLGLDRSTKYFFICPGEGTFHQLHGGVTTTSRSNRDEDLNRFSKQLEEISGLSPFPSLSREPILIGNITSHAQKFMTFSNERARKRFRREGRQGINYWPDDTDFTRYTESHP